MNAHPINGDKYELINDGDVVRYRLCLVYAKDPVGLGPDSMCQALALSDMGLMIGATSDGKKTPYNHGRWHSFNGLGIRARPQLPIATGTMNYSAMGLNDFLLYDHRAPSIATLPNLKSTISSRRRELKTELKNTVYQFLDLDSLPDYSLQKHLAYFSVIESMLSHSPAQGDSVDTITRQLIRNISLVNQRLELNNSSIPFSDFGNTASDKVIKSLYGYRSAIAHGGNVKDSLMKLNKLRPGTTKTDSIWMHDFLRRLTKRIIQAAIHEPELFSCVK